MLHYIIRAMIAAGGPDSHIMLRTERAGPQEHTFPYNDMDLGTDLMKIKLPFLLPDSTNSNYVEIWSTSSSHILESRRGFKLQLIAHQSLYYKC